MGRTVSRAEPVAWIVTEWGGVRLLKRWAVWSREDAARYEGLVTGAYRCEVTPVYTAAPTGTPSPQTFHRPVHNHGPEEGLGLACRETLIGECLRAGTPSPREEPPAFDEILGSAAGGTQQTAADSYGSRLEEENRRLPALEAFWRASEELRTAKADLDCKVGLACKDEHERYAEAYRRYCRVREEVLALSGSPSSVKENKA